MKKLRKTIRRHPLVMVMVFLVAAAAFGQTATVLFVEQVDTEAEFEALVTDVSNFIVSTEIDSEAEFEALIGALNVIISTEIDTFAELNAIITDATLLSTTGGTLTGELVIDDLGLEFTPGDALTDCSTFAATGGGIFFDDSEGVLKKCEDNVLTVLDTTGGTPAFSDISGATNTTAAMVVGTGASLGVSGSGTVTATDLVAGSEVVSDAEVVDTLTASNYLPLAGGTMSGDIILAERSSDPSNPAEGQWVCWMSDGVGSGADGDVLCKITAAAATKTITLFDFSAVP